MTWTPEQIAILRVILNDRLECPDCGQLPCRRHSAKAIGMTIGRTRNAVIGMAYRQGWSRPSPEKPLPPLKPERLLATPVSKDLVVPVKCMTPNCNNPRRRAYDDQFCYVCRAEKMNERLWVVNAYGQKVRRRGSTAIGDRG